jgi:hypothetical protein
MLPQTRGFIKSEDQFWCARFGFGRVDAEKVLKGEQQGLVFFEQVISSIQPRYVKLLCPVRNDRHTIYIIRSGHHTIWRVRKYSSYPFGVVRRRGRGSGRKRWAKIGTVSLMC